MMASDHSRIDFVRAGERIERLLESAVPIKRYTQGVDERTVVRFEAAGHFGLAKCQGVTLWRCVLATDDAPARQVEPTRILLPTFRHLQCLLAHIGFQRQVLLDSLDNCCLQPKAGVKMTDQIAVLLLDSQLRPPWPCVPHG